MTATRDARTGLGAGVGERLAALFAASGSAAVASTLASATVVAPSLDPIALYAAAVEADLEAALWLRPSEGTAFVGIGRAWAVEGAGPLRFQAAEAAWRDVLEGTRLDRPADAPPGAGPVLLGGMGFTGREPAAEDAWGPFGASSLVLPELLLTVTPLGAFVTASLLESEADGARRLETTLGAARRAGPGAAAEPQRHRRDAGVRAAPRQRRAAGPRRVAAAGRDVRRSRRPGSDRQGRAGATGGPPLTGGAGRPQRAAPPRRERPREHDLCVPARRADVPGRHAGAPRPDRGPGVPDRRGRGHDPPGRGLRPRTPSWPGGCWRPRRIGRST